MLPEDSAKGLRSAIDNKGSLLARRVFGIGKRTLEFFGFGRRLFIYLVIFVFASGSASLGARWLGARCACVVSGMTSAYSFERVVLGRI